MACRRVTASAPGVEFVEDTADDPTQQALEAGTAQRLEGPAVWAPVAVGAMAVQVGAGLVLDGRGIRPGNGVHVFYGIVIVFTFAFAYIYRLQLERRPELGYGLLLLFVMGLGLRAWSNVG